MYRVLKSFTDSNLNSVDETGEKHIYWQGSIYPYKKYAGAETKLRIKELTEGGYIQREGDK